MRYRREKESDAEALLASAVKRMHGLCLKLKFIGIDGAPDRLLFLPFGRLYFVELKKPGGRLEKSQQILFPMLEKIGFKIWILYGEEDVKKFIHLLESNDGI